MRPLREKVLRMLIRRRETVWSIEDSTYFDKEILRRYLLGEHIEDRFVEVIENHLKPIVETYEEKKKKRIKRILELYENRGEKAKEVAKRLVADLEDSEEMEEKNSVREKTVKLLVERDMNVVGLANSDYLDAVTLTRYLLGIPIDDEDKKFLECRLEQIIKQHG